jgi:hypothetical protein
MAGARGADWRCRFGDQLAWSERPAAALDESFGDVAS